MHEESPPLCAKQAISAILPQYHMSMREIMALRLCIRQPWDAKWDGLTCPWPASQIPHKCLNKERGVGVLWEGISWSCLSLNWELVWTCSFPSVILKLLDISGTYRSLLKLSAFGTVNTDSCPVSLRTWLPESSLSHHQHEGTYFNPLRPPPPPKKKKQTFALKPAGLGSLSMNQLLGGIQRNAATSIYEDQILIF